MRINSLNQVRYNNRNYTKNSTPYFSTPNFQEKPEFISNNNFLYYKKDNLIHVISFGSDATSNKNYEQIPSLKMKVAAVSKFQDAISEISERDVAKQPQVHFELDKEKKEIKLFYDKTQKQVGFIDYDILDHVYEEIEKNPQDFKMELASVNHNPAMKYQSLTARLHYLGADKENLRTIFEETTEDPKCLKLTYPYQKAQSPKSILNLIFKYEEQLHGAKAREDMEAVVKTITDVIKNPENKSFLLVGHQGPDGDDIACNLGMKNAIELMGQNKNVDCLIDDRIPALFQFLKGVKDLRISDKKEIIKSYEQAAQEKFDQGHLVEAGSIEKVKETFDKNTKELPKNKFYDVVILMDCSSPERAGYSYAKHIGPNTKVIVIDHHVKNLSAWRNQKSMSNIDLDDVIKNRLFWVADRVPAAGEMVAALSGELNPRLNDSASKYTLKEKNIVKNMATAVLTGIHTDTSSYSRSANLLDEDLRLPRYERPNYSPIGLAKWFSEITNRKITRNLIEAYLDEQDLKTKPTRKLASELLEKNVFRNDELQLNYAQIDKADLDKLWLASVKDVPTMTLKDILGTVKYSTPFKLIKRAINKTIKDDTIIYLMSKTNQKGLVNINGGFATKDVISFSFRSKSGTSHAAILAGLFNGGGHGAAAGGRIAGDGLNFDSNIKVLIDGVEEANPDVIYHTLSDNFQLDHMENPSVGMVRKEIKTVQAQLGDGRKISDLITDIVKEIRKSQIVETTAKKVLSVIA